MIIADTGFWLALANRVDDFHDRAHRSLDSIDRPLITTWPVLTETCHLLLHRLGTDAQTRFVEALASGASEIFDLTADHWPRIQKLMSAYADLPMDLADASLVVLAETLGQGDILSTDERDFSAYRWKHTRPFRNLLLEY